MDRAYFVWAGVLIAGGVLGLFLKARTVGICVGGVLGILLAAFLIGAAFRSETTIWMSGIALMAAPILGAILFLGAAVANQAVSALMQRREQEEEQ